jgi:hypothetical protein
MAKGTPYLQYGIRHECITPVTTLDIKSGILALKEMK